MRRAARGLPKPVTNGRSPGRRRCRTASGVLRPQLLRPQPVGESPGEAGGGLQHARSTSGGSGDRRGVDRRSPDSSNTVIDYILTARRDLVYFR